MLRDHVVVRGVGDEVDAARTVEQLGDLLERERAVLPLRLDDEEVEEDELEEEEDAVDDV